MVDFPASHVSFRGSRSYINHATHFEMIGIANLLIFFSKKTNASVDVVFGEKVHETTVRQKLHLNS